MVYTPYENRNAPTISYLFVECLPGSTFQTKLSPVDKDKNFRSYRIGDTVMCENSRLYHVSTVFWLGRHKARVELVPVR